MPNGRSLLLMVVWVVLLVLLLDRWQAQGQDFTFDAPASALLPNQQDSCIAWADLNGDVTHANVDLSVYFNDKNGNYLQSDAISLGVRMSQCAISIVNLNGDALPDIYLTGLSSGIGTRDTRAWLNFGQSGFSPIASPALPTGLSHPSLTWTDYNDDGRQDLLACGEHATLNTMCQIWKHNAGYTFTVATTIASSLAQGSAAVGWIKLQPTDNWTYLVTAGDSVGGAKNFIGKYFPLPQTFTTEPTTLFRPMQGGALVVADFDNSGTPDLLVVGNSGTVAAPTPDGAIWMNTGGVLTQNTFPFPQFLKASVTVANFNNDGLLDFAISGLLANSVPATMAYGFTISALQVLTSDTGFTNYTGNAMVTSCDLYGNGIKSLAVTGTSSGFFRNNNSPTTPSGPTCYNGFVEPVSEVCICYEGYSGATCDSPACPAVRCLTPLFYGKCVTTASECINETSSDIGLFSTQSLIPHQKTFDWRTGVTADLFTLNSGTKRGTVDIPAGILQAGAVSTLNLTQYPNVVLSVRAVDSDSVLNLTRYTPDQVFTVLVDLSFPASLSSTFTGSITVTFDLDPALNLTLSQACLAFLDFASWTCADRNLQQPTATSVSGRTSHFTEFGVLIAPEESSGDGGSDDNLVVILTTTIIIPLALLFVLVVIVVVVVVAALKGKYLTWWYNKRESMVQIPLREGGDEL